MFGNDSNKSKLNSQRSYEQIKYVNVHYHSVQNLLSSCLLSRNLEIKIYETVTLPVVLYGCETSSLTLREEHRLKMFVTGC
jgi:hypothetical protein